MSEFSPKEDDMAPDAFGLVDDFFRHENGRLVAHLTRVFGPEHLSLAEDVTQEALLRALQSWSIGGIPDNPSAWVTRVAKNLVLDALRHHRIVKRKEAEVVARTETLHPQAAPDETAFFEGEVRDDQLRMMFVCCAPELSQPMQVALILKTLCGFGANEIARAFLTNEAAIRKRLQRSREALRESDVDFDLPGAADMSQRLDGVLASIYFLFSEGYYASSGELLIREDLCREAIRLARCLIEHPAGDTPKAHALCALMLLLGSRSRARLDEAGDVLLLGDQPRDRWDAEMLRLGLQHLARSASGDLVSKYHLQAGIAACHSSAVDDTSTDWGRIVKLYDQLVEMDKTPVVHLNRAVAIAKTQGPESGLIALAEIPNRKRLNDYHLFYAVEGEFNFQAGHGEAARQSYTRALSLCKTEPERRFLESKLETLSDA